MVDPAGALRTPANFLGRGAQSMLIGLFDHWPLATNGVGSLGLLNLDPVNEPVFADGGMYLDGSNWLSSETHLPLTNGFTVSAWVSPTPSNNSPGVSQWQGGLGGFRLGADSLPVEQNIFGVSSYSGSQCVNPFSSGDTYYMLTGVFDAVLGQISLYKNDVLFARTFCGKLADSPDATFKIGTLDSGGEFMYQGFINNAAIWNRPFNQAQINALFNEGTPLPFSAYATTIA